MALSKKTSKAVRRYGPSVNRLARNRYHISGKQLLADLIQGESGDNPNAVSSAGAKGLTQFMPGTAASFQKAYGLNPYGSADQAVHAAALHLLGALGHSKGLEGYNPGGGQSYVNYILGQHASLAPGHANAAQGVRGQANGQAQYVRGPSTTQTIPGVDNTRARQLALLDYFMNERGQPGALIQIAQQLQQLPDIPARTKTIPGKRVRARDGNAQPQGQSGGQTAGPTGTHGLAYPLAHKGKLIGFPYQGTHTDFGNWQSDNAIDIATPTGTPVRAVTSGRIGDRIGPLDSSNPQLQGQRVYVIGNGNQWYYAHLSKIVVKPGQRVKKGQIIGYSGEANGVQHLHIAQEHGNPQKRFG